MAVTDFSTLAFRVDSSDLKKAGSDLRTLGKEASRTEDSTERFREEVERANKATVNLGGAAKIAGGLLASIGVGAGITNSIKQFSQFESGFNNIVTLLDNTSFKDISKEIGVEKLQKELLGLSSGTGQGLDTLNKALFDTVSAGVQAGDAVKFLEVASNLALAGATDTATAVDGMTSAINAFGLESRDAQFVSEAFFTAQKFGKTTIAELAGSIGKVAPAAKAMGVSLNETLAAVSAITTGGVSTSEAVTGLKAALANISKPSKDAADTAKSLGLQFDFAAIKSQGLNEFLQDVVAKTGGSEAQLLKLFGSMEAVNSVFALTGAQAGAFAGTLGALEDKSARAATFTDALKVKQAELSFVLGKLRQSVTVLAVKLGSAMGPAIAELASGIGSFVNSGGAERLAITLGSILSVAIRFGSGVLSGLSAGFSTLQAVFAPLASVASSFAGVFGGFSDVAQSAGQALGTAAPAIGAAAVAFKALGFVLTANPIGLAIRGIVLGAGLIVANWGKVKSFFANFSLGNLAQVFDNTLARIQQFAVNLPNTIKSLLGKGVDLVGALFGFDQGRIDGIKSAVTGAAQSIISTVSGLFSGGFNFVKSLFGGGDAESLDGIKGKILSTGQSIIGSVSGLLSGIGSFAKSIFCGDVDLEATKQAVISAATNVVNTVRGLVSDGFNFIKGLFPEVDLSGITARVGQVAQDALNAVKSVLAGGFSLVKAIFGDGTFDLSAVTQNITGAVSNLSSSIRNLLADIKPLDAIKSGFASVSTFFAGIFEELNLGPLISQFGSKVVSGLQTALGGITKVVTSIGSKIRSIFGGGDGATVQASSVDEDTAKLVNQIQNGFNQLDVASIVKTKLDTAQATISGFDFKTATVGLIGRIRSAFESSLDFNTPVSTALASANDLIKNSGLPKTAGINASGISSSFAKGLDFSATLSKIRTSIKSAEKATQADWSAHGRSLINTLADGVESGSGRLYSAVKDAVAAARRLLPSSDAKEGPLSNLTSSGYALPETFARGVINGRGQAISAVEGLAGELQERLGLGFDLKGFEETKRAFGDLFNNKGSGNFIQNAVTNLDGVLKNFNTDFGQVAGKAADLLGNAAAKFGGGLFGGKNDTTGIQAKYAQRGAGIGGGIGGAVGSIFGPLGAAIGKVGGQFLGSALGSLFGRGKARREAERRRQAELSNFFANVDAQLAAANDDPTFAVKQLIAEQKKSLVQAQGLRASSDQLNKLKLLHDKQLIQSFQDLTKEQLELMRGQLSATQFAAASLGVEFGSIKGAVLERIEADRALVSQLQSSAVALKQFREGLDFSDFSLLKPIEQLNLARAEFDKISKAARLGDPAAINKFQGAAEQLLSLSQEVNASGINYANDFNAVRDQSLIVEQLAGRQAENIDASATVAQTALEAGPSAGNIEQLNAYLQQGQQQALQQIQATDRQTQTLEQSNQAIAAKLDRMVTYMESQAKTQQAALEFSRQEALRGVG